MTKTLYNKKEKKVIVNSSNLNKKMKNVLFVLGAKYFTNIQYLWIINTVVARYLQYLATTVLLLMINTLRCDFVTSIRDLTFF